uniref:Uncharacterized protein n=1 Tax=Panagrolaimus superbus TaxID=310955 RepID=A0A914XUN9_9BILA
MSIKVLNRDKQIQVLRQEFVYLFVNENGLRFVCEICKDFQVNVYIDKTNLQEFELDEPFECLLKMDQLFASMIMKNATCMELIFEETENQIKLFRVNMEAPNVRTTLKLHTFNGGQVGAYFNQLYC